MAVRKEGEMIDWYGCYKGGWRNEIVPEAFSHPAKFARGLIRRIYEHAIEQGWLVEGSVVLDPFAGVCLGGIDAMFHGLHWVGVELEEKFVELGQGYDCNGRVASEPDGKLIGAKCGFMVDHEPHHVEGNIDLWNRRYGNGKLRRWGTAIILQGDSRNLIEVLGGACLSSDMARAIIAREHPPQAIVSSPPFSQSQQVDNRKKMPSAISDTWRKRFGQITDGTDPANLGNMPTGELPKAVIASPPYATQTVHDRCDIDPDKLTGNPPGPHSQVFTIDNYGDSDGQLAAMREGDVDAVIASPPHATSEVIQSHGRSWRVELNETEGSWRNVGSQYGDQDGQLAQMKKGEPQAAIVSSPPFCEVQGFHDKNFSDKWGPKQLRTAEPMGYGETEGNLGNMRPQDTFWSAAHQIVAQCYQVLAPGGHAIWVLKAFVRNKKIVDFPGQWEALCNSCGFETVEVIRAWLIEDRGAQFALNGELVERKVERKSFFRRLAERKGSPRIDYEVVLIVRKGGERCTNHTIGP